MIKTRARRAQDSRANRIGHDAVTLQERYLTDVYRYVARRVTSREEAEDITAEVFAAAFQALPRYRGESQPLTWLLGIARRKIVDWMRRRQSRPEVLISELSDGTEETGQPLDRLVSTLEEPEEALQRGETCREVRQLVAQLDADQREAILLKYVEGLPVAEVAVAMGRSPAALNSLLQRARASLFRRGREYFLGNGS